MMTRSREQEAKRSPRLPLISESELEQDLRIQSTNVSFPLMPLVGGVK